MKQLRPVPATHTLDWGEICHTHKQPQHCTLHKHKQPQYYVQHKHPQEAQAATVLCLKQAKHNHPSSHNTTPRHVRQCQYNKILYCAPKKTILCTQYWTKPHQGNTILSLTHPKNSVTHTNKQPQYTIQDQTTPRQYNFIIFTVHHITKYHHPEAWSSWRWWAVIGNCNNDNHLRIWESFLTTRVAKPSGSQLLAYFLCDF